MKWAFEPLEAAVTPFTCRRRREEFIGPRRRGATLELLEVGAPELRARLPVVLSEPGGWDHVKERCRARRNEAA